jgi:ATP-dependent DNA helicase RecQ
MLTTSQNQREVSGNFDPIEKLLAEAGLDRSQFELLSPTRQARLLRYFLPEPDSPITQEERAALLSLGQQLWQAQQSKENPLKGVLTALLDLFIGLDKTAEAAEVFALIYPEPVNQITYYERAARLCLAQNNNLGAWEAAVDLRRAFPQAMTTQLLLADLLLKMNDRAGARNCYETALELNPESPRNLLGLARLALSEGDLEQAQELAVQLEASAKISWRTLRQVGRLWYELGQPEKADQLEAAAQLSRRRAIGSALEGKDTQDEAEAGEVLEGIKIENNHKDSPASSPQPLTPDLSRFLQEVFGHSDFRPGQAEVIGSVLDGRDTLAVLPTGSGKSLCYQLPALVLERPVLVISPLISLMKDQFDNLPPRLQEQSAIINSTLEPGEAAKVLREIADGTRKLKLVYAAPERLRQYPFVAAMAQAGLGMVVVDEAHCVTMWGNDFRPDYLFIRRALDDLAETGHHPILLAVTATATPAIATEISNQLGRSLITVRGTVVRPNLYYQVVKSSREEREAQLVELCQELEGCGIIYVRSRQNAEYLAQTLQRNGISAGFYHAGLNNSARKRAQEDWSEGRTRIITATVAFGMGIDKPDVRFIIHYNLSDSVENYVQESGRAGRDGLPSKCVLFYSPSEKSSLTHFRKEDLLDIDTLRAIFSAVKKALGRRALGLVNADNLLLALNPGYNTEEEGVSETRLRVGLSLLERAGLLVRHYDLPPTVEITLLENEPDGPLATLKAATADFMPYQPFTMDLTRLSTLLDCPLPKLEPLLLNWARDGKIRYKPASGKREMLLELLPVPKESASERVNNLLEELETAHLRRVEQIADYAKTGKCRHAFLARHFGERLPITKCGACDICGTAAENPAESKADKPKTALTAGPSNDNPLTSSVLKALGNLKPGISMGKSGLSGLLLGKETGPQSERENPAWGALAGKIKPKALEQLIEQLIEEGFIGQQKVTNRYGQSYQALGLSEKGRAQLEASTQRNSSPQLEREQSFITQPELEPVQKREQAQKLPSQIELTREPSAPVSFTSQSVSTSQNDQSSPEDAYALATLRCLSRIDPTGRATAWIAQSGLVRLLQGQSSVLGTSSSNPYKGALAGRLKEKQIENLIERLIEEGFIERQEMTLESGRAYPALRLSADGWMVVTENAEN